jgi:hypothetical protein
MSLPPERWHDMQVTLARLLDAVIFNYRSNVGLPSADLP